jgi:hypothetical protein
MVSGLALMIGSVLLVLIVELLNSAIEATVDRISLDAAPVGQARQGHRQRCRPAGTAQRAWRSGPACCSAESGFSIRPPAMPVAVCAMLSSQSVASGRC